MPEDLGAVWRNQPGEKLPVTVDRLVSRRTRALFAGTRTEILASIGAALLFAAVFCWRFADSGGPAPLVAVAVVLAWTAISLYRFRDRIRRREPPPDALAATGLEHYRRELERRRDHLRNEWLWQGPVVIATGGLAWILLQRSYPERLTGVLPLLGLLAASFAYGIVRRRRQARELQREIDEIR